MSKILRRPMFRGGGPVSSYGNGITAPLVPGYQMGGNVRGGIVDLPGGYGLTANERLSDLIKNDFRNASVGTSGASIAGLPELTLGSDLYESGAVAPRPVTIPGVKDDTGSKEIEYDDLDIGHNLFGELDTTQTITLPNGETKQVLVESEGPSPLVELNLGLITKKEYKEKIEKNKRDSVGGRNLEEDAEINQQWYDDQVSKSIGDGDDGLKGDGVGEPTEISAKDAIAENQELFKELLGSKKARGQDISDMLLRFSGSQGNTLGEKFQNYTRAESASGPGRGEKINQTAAALAINDYVAGKRAEEQNKFLKTKIDYEYDQKAALTEIQDDDDVSTALSKMAKKTDSGFKSLKNMKALINRKTGRDDIWEGSIKMKDLKTPKKVNKLKPGYNIIEDEGVKRIVLIGNDGTNNTVISIETITELWSGN